jgi:hypothetical protein
LSPLDLLHVVHSRSIKREQEAALNSSWMGYLRDKD